MTTKIKRALGPSVRGPFGRTFVVTDEAQAVNVAQSIWSATEEDVLPTSPGEVQVRWHQVRTVFDGPPETQNRFLSIDEFWGKYCGANLRPGVAERALRLLVGYRDGLVDLFDPDQCDDGER